MAIPGEQEHLEYLDYVERHAMGEFAGKLMTKPEWREWRKTQAPPKPAPTPPIPPGDPRTVGEMIQ